MKTKFYCSLGKVCGEKPCWRHGVMDSFWPALTRQHPRTYTPYHTIPCHNISTHPAAKSPQLLFSSGMECTGPHPNPFSASEKVGLSLNRARGSTRVKYKCKLSQGWFMWLKPICACIREFGIAKIHGRKTFSKTNDILIIVKRSEKSQFIETDCVWADRQF